MATYACPICGDSEQDIHVDLAMAAIREHRDRHAVEYGRNTDEQ